MVDILDLKIRDNAFQDGKAEYLDVSSLFQIATGESANPNNIGIDGTTWFGTGWCDPDIIPDHLHELPGTRMTDHPDYGNYEDDLGSRWVCFPHTDFRRLSDTGKIEVSNVTDGTFAVDPAFVINGVPRRAIFVMKYFASFQKFDGTNYIISQPGTVPLHRTAVDAFDNFTFARLKGAAVNTVSELDPFLYGSGIIPLTIYAYGLIGRITAMIRNSMTSKYIRFLENTPPIPAATYLKHLLFRNDIVQIPYTGSCRTIEHSTHNGLFNGVVDVNAPAYTILTGLRQLVSTYALFNVDSWNILNSSDRLNLSAYLDMPTDAQNAYGYKGFRKSGVEEFYDPEMSQIRRYASGANFPRREAIDTDLGFVDPTYGTSGISLYHGDVASSPFFCLGTGEYGLNTDFENYTATMERITFLRYMCYSKE